MLMALGLMGLSLTGQWGRAYDIFVDSVNGDDGNDGLTAATAKQTLSAITLADGLHIGLARGSSWRESIVNTTFNNVSICAYGTGAMPIIDCADVASAGGWTPHGSFAGIWQRTWTHDALTGQYISLWEDGERMYWVSSEANLDAASEGYYVATTGGGATSTVFYKPTGGADPSGSGIVVEIATRLYAINDNFTDGWKVVDIHTKRSLSLGGSLYLAGSNGVIRRCLAEDGTSHNLFIGANGLVEDTICWKADWPDRVNAAMFVAYTNDGRGYSATFRRCVAVGETAQAIYAKANALGYDGFYAHTAGGVQYWDNLTFEDCSGKNLITVVSGTNCLEHNATRIDAENSASLCLFNAVNDTNLTDLRYIEGALGISASVIETTAGDLTCTGHRVSHQSAMGKGAIYSVSPTTVVTNGVIHRQSGGSGYAFGVQCTAAVTSLTHTNNIYQGPADAGTQALSLSGTGALDSEDNVFWISTIDFTKNVTSYLDFASWQSGTGLDTNSVAEDPLLVDPANGDFNVEALSPAIALGAGLVDPDVTYTAIPSDAALAAM